MSCGYRENPLPAGPAVGRLVVTEPVMARTADLLRAAGGDAPPREGLVFWFGRSVGTDTVVLACHSPACDSGSQHVMADEAAVGQASRAARARRLGLVAQVHSHPGTGTCHSDGDDILVLMPFEGMFSLVVANYGAGVASLRNGAGVHQFQAGRWVLVEQDEPAVVLVPVEIAG